MPSESSVFTTRVDPISPPRIRSGDRRSLVEAPGTAPGSAMPIPQAVYRHSQFPDRLNIGACCLRKKRRVEPLLRDQVWRSISSAMDRASIMGEDQSPGVFCKVRRVALRNVSRPLIKGTLPAFARKSIVGVPTAAEMAEVAVATDITRSRQDASAATPSISFRRSRSGNVSICTPVSSINASMAARSAECCSEIKQTPGRSSRCFQAGIGG